MTRLYSTIAGVSFASLVVSSPLQPHLVRQIGGSPCAQVSASVAAQASAATPTVPAQLAYDCITSVPFNQSAALALVDGVVPYFKWQSNIVWLKDPPQEYAEKVQGPVDVWGGLGNIRAKAVAGNYSNEFEVYLFQSDLRNEKLIDRVWFRALYPAPIHARWPLRLHPG